MGVKNSELADLIATTLADLPSQEFEVEWTNQDYEFCRVYQQTRIQIDGGTEIKRNVMLNPTGNARYRRLYDTDEPTVGDVQYQITVPWAQIGTNYSWDKVEILRNKNSEKGFVNLMESKRIDGLWSLADLIEERAWLTPTSSTDDLNPYGVPYYLNLLNTGITAAGFNGQTITYQDASTGNICAGINASDESKWRNYAAVYSNIDNSFLKTYRRAVIATQFKAPLIVNDPGKDALLVKRTYAGLDETVALQDLLDSRDDNHKPVDLMGGVLAQIEGTVLLNRTPVVYIPNLDSTTLHPAQYNPIFTVDFRKFVPFVQDGYWMEEGEPMTDRGQHTTFTVFLDGAHNNLCTSRRKCGFVLHNAT
jgi:hypothetical protein